MGSQNHVLQDAVRIQEGLHVADAYLQATCAPSIMFIQNGSHTVTRPFGEAAQTVTSLMRVVSGEQEVGADVSAVADAFIHHARMTKPIDTYPLREGQTMIVVRLQPSASHSAPGQTR